MENTQKRAQIAGMNMREQSVCVLVELLTRDPAMNGVPQGVLSDAVERAGLGHAIEALEDLVGMGAIANTIKNGLTTRSAPTVQTHMWRLTTHGQNLADKAQAWLLKRAEDETDRLSKVVEKVPEIQTPPASKKRRAKALSDTKPPEDHGDA
jgi:hypothetical protein